MTPLLIAPDLRQACPEPWHFPGDERAVEPHATYSTGATLRADYRCLSGFAWSRWWSGDSPWPLESAELQLNRETPPIPMKGLIPMASTTEPQLPTWSELSDLDKGAALLFLHKRDWEGEDYAIENYPARYFDHPALTSLGRTAACRHAVSVEDDADLSGALRGDEFERLYDLALNADREPR